MKPLFKPVYRLFLTMDPCHGEISRAMRNRGIEVYIHSEVYIYIIIVEVFIEV